ncbi:isoprenyl transferase [Thermithiobacillus plumbiphilus]|uniref:Isoprenyl transferase n=1 Tax=Thermithiobacillus plumbiphilus TaxID=1729899 RepID=A0ABU9D3M4_9PROT
MSEGLAPASQLPRHVAIIMDGNGRWARQRFLPRVMGHHRGADRVRDIVEDCVNRRISALTLFAFSSENWRRPASEVSLLMNLFQHMLQREAKRMHSNGIRLRIIGDRRAFSPELQDLIDWAESLTARNTSLMLTIAANYGGRWDIAQAARSIAEEVANGELSPEQIDEQMMSSRLSLADLPEPDLFIRTGGEQRVSNFLLWQLAYTELYFTDILWPDFDGPAFEQALLSYGRRQRRFGRTGDQLANEEC